MAALPVGPLAEPTPALRLVTEGGGPNAERGNARNRPVRPGERADRLVFEGRRATAKPAKAAKAAGKRGAAKGRRAAAGAGPGRGKAVWSDGTRVAWESGVITILAAGERRRYLNAALPTPAAEPGPPGVPWAPPVRPLASAVCPRCGYAYAHLYHRPAGWCEECRVELAARRGELLQRLLGVNLGWDRPDDDHPDFLRRRYGFSAERTVALGEAERLV